MPSRTVEAAAPTTYCAMKAVLMTREMIHHLPASFTSSSQHFRWAFHLHSMPRMDCLLHLGALSSSLSVWWMKLCLKEKKRSLCRQSQLDKEWTSLDSSITQRYELLTSVFDWIWTCMPAWESNCNLGCFLKYCTLQKCATGAGQSGTSGISCWQHLCCIKLPETEWLWSRVTWQNKKCLLLKSKFTLGLPILSRVRKNALKI